MSGEDLNQKRKRNSYKRAGLGNHTEENSMYGSEQEWSNLRTKYWSQIRNGNLFIRPFFLSK